MLYSYIDISTMLFNYTQMKMAHLYQTSPNMRSIKEVFDTLGKTFLASIVGNHWATGGLWVNSTPDYNLSFVTAQREYNIADHCEWQVEDFAQRWRLSMLTNRS